MAQLSNLVAVGQSTTITFSSPVTAVTLSPDSLLDAVEVGGQTLHEGGVVYLPPTTTVPVRRARNRHHAHGSQGALAGLIGWSAGETAIPQKRDRWRYEWVVTAGPAPDYTLINGTQGPAIAPVYGRRNMRATVFCPLASPTAVAVAAMCVSYTGEGYGRVVDVIELIVSGSGSAPSGGAIDNDFALEDILGVVGSTRTAITRGEGSVALACDEVWFYSASDPGPGRLIVEVW